MAKRKSKNKADRKSQTKKSSRSVLCRPRVPMKPQLITSDNCSCPSASGVDAVANNPGKTTLDAHSRPVVNEVEPVYGTTVPSICDQPERTLLEIPLDRVIPDKEQPRRSFPNLDLLRDSILENGQYKPILVVTLADNKYKIIDGERRWRAMTEIAASRGITMSEATIAAICVTQNRPQDGLIMNVMRSNYSPMEIAYALNRLRGYLGASVKELSRKLGKSESNIKEYLSLLRLPLEIQESALADNCVPFYKLKALVSKNIPDEEKIARYRLLYAQYSGSKAGNQDCPDAQLTITTDLQKGRDLAAIRTRKKLKAMSNKLDAASRALEVFAAEQITDYEGKMRLSEKLEKIIAGAEKLRKQLMPMLPAKIYISPVYM